MLEPSRLNQDVLVSIITVLHDNVAPGARSPTKIVMLSAVTTRPGEPRRAISEALIGHQFDDLRASQAILLKQSGWLDVVFVSPGMLLDSEPTIDPLAVGPVELREGGAHPGALSYARLASAMLLASGDAQYVGKFLTPIPTTKVPVAWKHLKSQRSTIYYHFVYNAVPFLTKVAVLATISAGLGYVIGVREQGDWPLKRFGWDLRR